MPLGGATKKLQQVVDMADELYAKLNELRQQVQEVRERVENTDERVERIERTLEGQQALLETIAAEQDVDVEAVLTEAAIEEAEDDDDGESTT
jgi:DNA repair ATPase RecN